jgi:hypothetical protein
MDERLKQGIEQSIGHAAYQLEQRVESILAKLPRWMQLAIRAQTWVASKVKRIR